MFCTYCLLGLVLILKFTFNDKCLSVNIIFTNLLNLCTFECLVIKINVGIQIESEF